jgi:hypothetical protein
MITNNESAAGRRHMETMQTLLWYIQGAPQKTQNHWNNVLLKFECPSTKLNAKMRKIWQGRIY